MDQVGYFRILLWHLDPLRTSAFVPLPRWIHVGDVYMAARLKNC